MIDLSAMNDVRIDPGARRARVGGGALLYDLDFASLRHGLATTAGIVSHTGVGGLTLGGGYGRLGRKLGLTIDSLVAADLVCADGRARRLSAEANKDLFWAIRGGGGNFGIATSLEYNLHAVGPTITGGLVAHPFAKSLDVLRFFREQCATASDDMALFAGLLTAPDGAKLVGILAAHFGSLSEGEAAVKPLKTFGPPVMDAMGPLRYCTLNGLLDPSFPRGALNYWKAQFITNLTDDCIRTLMEQFERCPSPMSQIVIEEFHGASTRVGLSDTACTLRTRGFDVVLVSQWSDPRDTDTCTRWCRETYAALKPFLGSARYMNYLAHDESDAQGVYGPNYPRLQELKRKYDPENFFHTNVNIRPA
jgi:FAD/FMN-containing dehydrogenase